MEKIVCSSQYFNIQDTLCCGQLFRFEPYKKGYKVFFGANCLYAYTQGDTTVIECSAQDKELVREYFDLTRDYSLIVKSAIDSGVEILAMSAKNAKGIRILKQDAVETLFSFIISQNNNIPRIKGIIEKLCYFLGEKREFNGEQYFTFPTVSALAGQSLEFYKSVGLGYRAPYIKKLAEDIVNGLDIKALAKLDAPILKKELLKIYGVGPKVADCVLLFGFGKTNAFPVDTWIEKVYRENFLGKLKDRVQISEFFTRKFGENSGFFQQYLFYNKREREI